MNQPAQLDNNPVGICAQTFFMLFILFGIADGSEITWPTSAGNSHSARFFSGDQINQKNINKLEPIWTHYSGYSSPFDTVQASPIFTGKELISVNLDGYLISISPTEGKENWRKKLALPLGRRGLSYSNSQNQKTSGIYVASGDQVVHLDASDGSIKNRFDTGKSLLQSFVFNESLIVATLREGIKSFDIITGKKQWETSLVKNSVTSRVWSGFSFDPETRSIVVVTSNPGGIVGDDRDGDDYSVSVIVLSAENGSILWVYQHIKNDLWDFDLVGNPIIIKDLKLSKDRAKQDCVIALSKTGDVIVLDLLTGKPVFKDSFKNVPVPSSDIDGVKAATHQKKYRIPAPFESIELDPAKDFNHLDEENLEYVKTKLRHAKAGFYVPPSLNYDMVTYGVHGGAEWPGGSIYKDSESAHLIIPSNRYPWILHVYYSDGNYEDLKSTINSLKEIFNNIKTTLKSVWDKLKSIFSSDKQAQTDSDAVSKGLTRWSIDNWGESKVDRLADYLFQMLPYSLDNDTYIEKCSECHGNARQGKFQSEFFGDGLYPPLVGISTTDKWNSVDTIEKARSLHNFFGVGLNTSGEEYDAMMKYFAEYDQKLKKENKLVKVGFWQLILDKKGMPATTPPWGKITNINLLTGAKEWSVPLGVRKAESSGDEFAGDINFGGVLTTKSKIVFATGTPDQNAYAYSMKTGKVIWKTALPYAGSAQPMAFSYRGCDVVVFTATGGRFWGFGVNGDTTVAYKLRSCDFG